MILGHLTHPRLGRNHVENALDGEPDNSGDVESGDVVLDHAALAADISAARDVDEAGQEEQSPEPATFHDPLIEKVVRICKVAPEIDDLSLYHIICIMISRSVKTSILYLFSVGIL